MKSYRTPDEVSVVPGKNLLQKAFYLPSFLFLICLITFFTTIVFFTSTYARIKGSSKSTLCLRMFTVSYFIQYSMLSAHILLHTYSTVKLDMKLFVISTCHLFMPSLFTDFCKKIPYAPLAYKSFSYIVRIPFYQLNSVVRVLCVQSHMFFGAI